MVINSKIYGNDRAWHNLVNDSLTGRVAHAYIFSGTQGIGKATIAKEYIKYLLGADNILSERIDQGEFLDLLYISKQDKSEITIDQIRKAREFFSHTAAEGYQKFVIIDAAEDLNLNASNALLKILEEPTKNTYLFLISHSPYKLLSTIRSRCRIVKFKPLNIEEIKSSNLQMEDFVAGSFNKANLCEEQSIPIIYERILALINNEDIIAFNKFSDEVIKNSQQWQLIVELFLYLINRCIKLKINVLAVEKITDIEKSVLLDLSRTKTIESWYKIYDEFLLSTKQLDVFNLDKHQLLLLTLENIRKKEI